MNNTKLEVANAVRTETYRLFANDGMNTGLRKCFPSGMEVSINVKIPWAAMKADLKPCLQELAAMKMPQKAMAFFTGMSQGYVSKLLH